MHSITSSPQWPGNILSAMLILILISTAAAAGAIASRLLTNYKWLKLQEASLSQQLDVLRTNDTRLRASLAEVQNNYALVRQESDSRAETIAALTSQVQIATNQLSKFRMPSQTMLAETGFKRHALNNPFLDRKDEIRQIKKTATDIQSLFASLEPVARSFHRWGDKRDLAVGAMLIVATFYDYGNPIPNDAHAGCVSINQNTAFESIGELTFRAQMDSDIGCCTDFAMLLSTFLDYLGLDSNILLSEAHQTTQVKVNDKWHFIDANSLIFIDNYFENEPKELFYFTPYEGARSNTFQHFLIKALVFGEKAYARSDWQIKPLQRHLSDFNASYLSDAISRWER